MKHRRYENKKKMYPRVTARLPLFLNVMSSETKNGKLEILKGQELTQTHRDILEAIAIAGKKANYQDGRACYVFTPYDVLKVMGHSDIKNHKWFIQKLAEIKSVNVKLSYEDKLRKLYIVGGIIDMFGYTKIKRNKKAKSSFGDTYFAVVFSDIFTKLLRQDIIVWTHPEITKHIIKLRYDFLKAVIRFCFTHEQINMSFDNLLKNMGIYNKIADRTKRKFRQMLQMSQEELQKVGITITKKDGELYIFYRKNPNRVMLDYQVEGEKAKKSLKINNLKEIGGFFSSQIKHR